MILGLSSIISFREGVKTAISIAQRYGIPHLDIFCSPKHFDLHIDEEFLREVKAISEKNSISLSLKAPAFTQNIASMNDYVRALSIKQYKRCIDMCNYLKCGFVTIRAGIFFYEEKRKIVFAWKRLIEALEDLLEYGERRDVEILVENYYLPMDAVRRIKDLKRITQLLSNYENFGLALNIAHLMNVRRRKSDQILEIEDLREYIKLLYVGLPPTPWDTDYDLSKFNIVIRITKYLLNRLRDSIVIIASTNRDIAERFLNNIK